MNFQPYGQSLSDQVTLLKLIESFFLVPKTLFDLLEPRQAKSKEILGGYIYKRKLFQRQISSNFVIKQFKSHFRRL